MPERHRTRVLPKMARSVQGVAQLPRPPKKPTFAPPKPTRWRRARAACPLPDTHAHRGVETRRSAFKRTRKSRIPREAKPRPVFQERFLIVGYPLPFGAITGSGSTTPPIRRLAQRSCSLSRSSARLLFFHPAVPGVNEVRVRGLAALGDSLLPQIRFWVGRERPAGESE